MYLLISMKIIKIFLNTVGKFKLNEIIYFSLNCNFKKVRRHSYLIMLMKIRNKIQ